MTWGRGSTRQSRRERAQILERDSHQCQIAGPNCIGHATEDDHIIPLSQGGTDHLANRRAACSECHREKSQREAQAGKAKSQRPAPRHPGG